jgi:hypothetical protein
MGADHSRRSVYNQAVMADLLRASLLDALHITHGFSLRTGGTSAAPFDSLNVARAVGDDPTHVQANLNGLAKAIGYRADALFEVSQVHGNNVRRARPDDDAAVTRAQEADVLVAIEPGVAVGIRVADCIAALIVDPRSGAVAGVHAGWRGVVSRAADAAIDALVSDAGAHVSELRVATFPHIRGCCFEVGEDVAQTIAGASAATDVIDRSRPKPHIHLLPVLQAQLIARGVVTEHMQDIAGCTYCEPERFFSFRRDGTRSGRHLAVIVAGGQRT